MTGVFTCLFLFFCPSFLFHLSCSLLLSLPLPSLFLMSFCTMLSSSLLLSGWVLYPLQSHNLAPVLCHPLPSLSSRKHLQTTTTQLQAFLSSQCFSLQLPMLFHSNYFPLTVLYLTSIFFPLTFTLFLLFSSCLSLGTSDSLFTHFCNYRLSSPFSCFFQVSVFFKIHNLLNFRCGVKWVVVAYPITRLVATNQVEAYCCYWGN